MKHERMFKKDLARVDTPAIDKILPTSDAKQTKRVPRAKKRVGVLAMSVILCCVMVLGAAAVTTAPLIKKILNDKRVTENTQQLTVVPEGYVGIYTKEELLRLNAIRDVGQTHFILMNDITFTEEDYGSNGMLKDGFQAIKPNRVFMENGEWKFEGIEMFNGNGHVIRNLKFSDNGMGCYGLFYGSVASIINLGLENCEINVTANTDYADNIIPDLYIGAIAARGSFIGACYVDGLTINVQCNLVDNNSNRMNMYEMAIGGIGGEVNYIDSCYVNNATIKVSGPGFGARSDRAVLVVGGVVGIGHSCITSWFSGEVSNTVEGLAWTAVGDITESDLTEKFPILMDAQQFEQLRAMVAAKYVEDSYNYKIFRAYYLEKNFDKLNSERAKAELMAALEQLNSMTGGKMDLVNQKEWYLFDSTASYTEKARIYEILLDAYNGDTAALEQMCEYSYIQSGATDCYVLDLSRALNSDDLPGFDFDTVWTFRDGKPVQQVFVH